MALDWGSMTDTRGNVTPSSQEKDLPVLLILPGIAGSSDETYCQHLVKDGILTGYRPVVFNQRGYGGMPLKVSNGEKIIVCF